MTPARGARHFFGKLPACFWETSTLQKTQASGKTIRKKMAKIFYQVFLNICQKNFSDIRQVFAKRICQMPVMYTGTRQQKLVSLIQN